MRLFRLSGWWLTLGAVVVTSCVTGPPPVPPNPLGVRIVQTNDVLEVELNGRLFARYQYANGPRPVCFPLLGPGDRAMTRSFPLAKVPGESTDHPHHRSLWFGHAPVNGVDFWTEGRDSGRIVHRGFTDIASGVNTGHIKARHDWLDAAGRVICSDETTIRFQAPTDSAITLDYEIRLDAAHGEVVFGDSKEGFFALRMADSLRVFSPGRKGQPAFPAGGKIVLSTGIRDDGASAMAARQAKSTARTWGQRAAWCDYHGPMEGKIVGIAVLDHPANPRHPTWWMVRDYGLLAANPFGQHEFEGGPDPRAGEFRLPAGESVTFRYRLILHEGDEQAARIAERFAEFAATPPP
jgi:hypothetical protein